MTDVEITGGPLSRFLQMVGFEYDLIRSKTEALRNVNNPDSCPGNLLPLLASELGLQYEFHLGMAQNRQLLANLVNCYKTKGSITGIENIVEALTGWSSSVSIGPNLVNTTFSEPRAFPASPTILSAPMGTAMVEAETSSLVIQPTPGPTWPLIWYTNGNVGTVLSYAAWIEEYQSTALIPATLYFVTAGGSNWTNSASYVDFSTAINASTQAIDPVNYGIAVPAGATVVSSSILVSVIGGMAVTFNFLLEFFSENSTSLGLSSTEDTHTYSPTGSFDQYKVQNVAVPTGAVWFALHLHMLNTGAGNIISGVGTGVIVAAPMANTGATVLTYVPPREILTTLYADRENIVANPSFENNATTGWTGTNCTLAVESGVYYEDPNNLATSDYCLKATMTGTTGQSMSVTSAMMTIDNATRWWSASVYAQAPATVRNVSISMLFYNSASMFLGTIAGTAVAETVGAWTRVAVTTQSVTSPTEPVWTQALGAGILPAEVASVEVTITWTDCSNGEVHYMDAAMVEKADQPGVYFDGDYYDSLYTSFSDYQWAGGNTTKTGPSYYYRNFYSKFLRLDQVLSGSSNAGLTLPGTNPNLTVPAAPVQSNPTIWNGQVTVEWAATISDGGAPLLGYNVFMGTSPGAESGTPINGSTLVAFSPYTVTDLANSTEYYFTVKAVTSAGSSAASNEKSATPNSGDGVPATHIGPGHLVTVWEVPGQYNTSGSASSGLIQYSGQRFGSGNGPLGIIWIRSKVVGAGVVVNA